MASKRDFTFSNNIFAWSKFKQLTNTVELSKQIALIIAPVLKEKAFGLEITGGQCYLENKIVRDPDDNPYEVDIHSDPLANFHTQLQLTVLLPNAAFIPKFRQMIPSIEETLQAKGVVSVKVRCKVEPKAWTHLRTKRP